MRILFCLLVLALPLMAVDVTITIGGRTETFAVSADDVDALIALRASRAHPETDQCPPLRLGGVFHDCSTETLYVMWKLKQLFNSAKETFPQGADATDAASIAVIESDINDRRVE